MNRLLIVLAASTFIATSTGLYWWLDRADTIGKGKAFTHMHCPDCLLETTYNKAIDGKRCPHCGSAGPRMVPTVGRYAAGGAASASHTGAAFAAVTIALVLTQAGLYGWILVARSRHRAAAAARSHHLVCRCPFCQRKIGYAHTKIGSSTICSRCKTAFTLPEDGIAEEP